MGKKRSVEDEPEPAGEEQDEEIEDEEDEEQQVLEGDELQEVMFDVDVMSASDVDGVFHLLQRWCPLAWCIDMDDVITPMSKSSITSIVKIPDTQEPEVNLGNDENDIFGVLGCINLTEEVLTQHKALRRLLDNLCGPAPTEEKKRDICTLLSPEALQKHSVALIVNERIVNLPKELGAQLHVNMFNELADQEPSSAAEYYIILARVRLHADEQVTQLEEDERAAKEGRPPRDVKEQEVQPKKKRSLKAPSDLLIDEETSLFTRPEELMYFRNRDPEFSVKRFVLDPEVSPDLVIAPVVVHRSKLELLVRHIKSLDAYFLTNQ